MANNRALVFYSAYTQHENLGDLIINREVVRLLVESGADVKVNVLGCPPYYLDQLRAVGGSLVAKSGFSFVTAIVWAALTSPCVWFVMKPGHFFGKDGGVLRRLLSLLVFRILQVFGVKIARYGASVGPFVSGVDRLERLRASTFTSYTAREEISIAYCQKIGVDRVVFCPDLAFCLPVESPTVRAQIRSTVVVSFRSGTTSVTDQDYLDNVDRLIRPTLQLLDKQGNRLCFLAQVTMDGPACTRLRESSVLKDSDQLVFDGCNSEAIFSVYGNCSVVISNRLHVLLFAASRGAVTIPVVDAGKHGKIVGIFDSIGLSELVFDLGGSADEFQRHVALVFSRLDEYREKLRAAFLAQESIVRKKIFQDLGVLK